MTGHSFTRFFVNLLFYTVHPTNLVFRKKWHVWIVFIQHMHRGDCMKVHFCAAFNEVKSFLQSILTFLIKSFDNQKCIFGVFCHHGAFAISPVKATTNRSNIIFITQLIWQGWVIVSIPNQVKVVTTVCYRQTQISDKTVTIFGSNR